MRPASSSRIDDRSRAGVYTSPSGKRDSVADTSNRHVRRPSGIVTDAMARSPPPKHTQHAAAEIHTSVPTQQPPPRQTPSTANPLLKPTPHAPPRPSLNPPSSNEPPSPPPPPTPTAAAPRKPEKTTVIMNIHMAAAFDRAPVVTDLREIPWARQGDIIAVRPVERREWEPGANGGGGGGGAGTGTGKVDEAQEQQNQQQMGTEPTRENGDLGSGKRTTRSDRGGKGPKGHFLFRLGGNDETKLKKLQQVSSPKALRDPPGVCADGCRLAAFVV